MTNQPDIVQPRVRRTGNSGNTPATLAEQSTRVLIQLPRVAGSPIQPLPTQSQPVQPQSIQQHPTIQPQVIRPQAVQPQALPTPLTPPKLSPADRTSAPAASDRSHYSTTTELLRGSPTAQRPAATPSPQPVSPPVVSPQPTRIDAAHRGAIGPHSAAPEWLDDRSGNKVTQTRLLLVVGVIAGFALGALTWHGHGNRAPATQNSASRIQSPAQESPNKSSAAANVSDTAAVEFNLPAQVSHTAAEGTNCNKATTSTWDWSPKAAANEPATIDQAKNSTSDRASAVAPASAQSHEVQTNDPSRAAWLQGTIDTVHSTSAPVQR